VIAELETIGDPKLEGKLLRLGEGDVEAVQELLVTSTSTTFRDVGADREGRTSHLLCEAETLFRRKLRCEPIHTDGQPVRVLRDG
jgi:hypothetical protein